MKLCALYLRFIIFLLISSFLPSTSFSFQFETPYEQTIYGNTTLKVYTSRPGAPGNYQIPDDADVKNIIQKISDINKFYEEYFILPRELNLLVLSMVGPDFGFSLMNGKQSLIGGSYNIINNFLTTGVVFAYHENYKKYYMQTNEKSLAITAHEYGHVLFYLNLEATDPAFAQINNVLTESLQLDEEYQSLNEHLLACDIKKGSISHFFDGHCRKIQKITHKQKEIYEDKMLSLFKMQVLLPYSELFSDVLAVLEANNTEVVADVFRVPHYPEIEDHEDYIAARSFTACPSAIGYSTSEPHLYFSPVRCEIGNLIRSKDQTNFDKAQFLKNIFNILVTDFQFSLSKVIEDNPKLKRHYLDSEADNLRLIKALQNFDF